MTFQPRVTTSVCLLFCVTGGIINVLFSTSTVRLMLFVSCGSIPILENPPSQDLARLYNLGYIEPLYRTPSANMIFPHLANERTFLGYLRTSMMMSMVGTLVAQLFTINHETNHGSGFGYFAAGKPLAITCYAFSIGTILLGAVRSWRHQHTMLSGKALSGGFEIHCLGICSVLVG